LHFLNHVSRSRDRMPPCSASRREQKLITPEYGIQKKPPEGSFYSGDDSYTTNT
jgi:hypothetical protein